LKLRADRIRGRIGDLPAVPVMNRVDSSGHHPYGQVPVFRGDVTRRVYRRADGDMSWLADHVGPNPVVVQLITATGAILLDHRTFGGDAPYKGQSGEGVPRVKFVGEIDTAAPDISPTCGIELPPRSG
jgi:hypothetical protein